jgi:hypothetical protein
MRRRARRLRWTALVLAAGAGAAISGSCVDLDSLGNGAPDAGDHPDAEAGAPADPCIHVNPVPAPDLDDSPGEMLPPFETAFDEVTVNPTTVPGYDIDGLCTCDQGSISVGKGGGSCAGPSPGCDLDGGIDNAAGLVEQGATGVLSFDRFPNRLIASGARSLLIQLAEYNGKANDKEVIVGTILSEGIREPGCATSTYDPDAGIYTPGRCGDDHWSSSPGAMIVTGSGNVPLVKGTGYVRDFHLVARIGNPVPVPFTASSDVTFAGAVLTATVVPLGEDLKPRDPSQEPTVKERRLFRLENGVLAGRVGANELLHTIGTYQSGIGTLCKLGAAFDQVRTPICGAVDVRREPGSTPNPALPCDALSAAFGFTALPAIAGAVSTAPPPDDPCGGVDAGAFTCP